MEVALAAPRTPDQYVQGLHDGLELTERMRVLVEAIREVTDLAEEKNETLETTELRAVLRETLDDLAPVAEMKSVRVAFDSPAASSLVVKAGQRRITSTIFRLLESALGLCADGSVLRVETGGTPPKTWFRVQWLARQPPSAFTQPELGLMVAQAGLERTDAVWERERTDVFETVTVHLPNVPENHR